MFRVELHRINPENLEVEFSELLAEFDSYQSAHQYRAGLDLDTYESDEIVRLYDGEYDEYV